MAAQRHCALLPLVAVLLQSGHHVVADENVEEALQGIVHTEWAYSSPHYARKAFVDKMDNRASDIFVASWPKSGTNWMKQLVHAIRLRGDPKLFEAEIKTDLSDIIPFLEGDPDVDHDSLVKAYPKDTPRVYQTHLKYEDVPKTGNIIYMMRDLPDVAVSFYKFVQQFDGMLVDNTVDEVARMMMDGKLYYGAWEEHIKSYFEVKDRHLLLVKYEDFKANTKQVIEKVVEFMNVYLSDIEMARVEELVSFDSMKKNSKRISGPTWAMRITGQKVDPDYKLVNDALGSKGKFSAEMRELMQKYWVDKAKPLFGAATYEDLKLHHPPGFGDEL
jgi:hypothetical protein